MIPVQPSAFATAFDNARDASERIRMSCAEFAPAVGATYCLTDDQLSGFVVRPDGELVNLFSCLPGRGRVLMDAAVAAGATRLDCFDGYLPMLYGRHGFREVRRESNWTAGAPDILYMELT